MKLLDQIRQVPRVRHYSYRTEQRFKDLLERRGTFRDSERIWHAFYGPRGSLTIQRRLPKAHVLMSVQLFDGVRPVSPTACGFRVPDHGVDHPAFDDQAAFAGDGTAAVAPNLRAPSEGRVLA
jgi:hypothetical protein